jgi:lipopolysaccharide export system protein LptA
MQAVLFIMVVIKLLAASVVWAQDGVGPEIPIVLEHADSLIGSGAIDAAVRTFQGNVRFSQGNVTGRCDRAVHDVFRNTIELTGAVVIRQAELTITAPSVRYDGRQSIAHAPRGLRIDQGGRTITSRIGQYDLRKRIAAFQQNVHAVDDSIRMWCDTLVHDRSIDTMLALGNVVIQDSARRSWFRADQARRDALTGRLRLNGSSRAWTWPQDPKRSDDTVFIAADEMRTESDGDTFSSRMIAAGSVRMVSAEAAATSGRMEYSDRDSLIDLTESPVVWSDSSVLLAKTIQARSSGGEIRMIVGDGDAALISRSDSLVPERYDQIVGKRITIAIQSDSVKLLMAFGDAQSITFRQESGDRKGLAKVAADTINATIVDNALTDVFWLGGVSGENHPERLVTGREAEFAVPGFRPPPVRPVYEPAPVRRSMLR